MMEDSTRQSLLKALDDLQRELDEKTLKLSELERVRTECEEINSLMRQIKRQLGLDTPAPIEIPGTVGLLLGIEGNLRSIFFKPIAEGISEIFDEYKRSMDIVEIVTEFRKRQWKLSENNPEEVIRRTLKRNPKLFMKVARGKWTKIRRRAQFGSLPAKGGEIK